MNKPSLLVLTSTFPRWRNDGEPAFILDLCRQLVASYQVTVIAPHFDGAAREEVMQGVSIRRFRYSWPAKTQVLAYRGGILANLRTHPASWLLLPFFFFFQWLAVVQAVRRGSFSAIHAHWIIPQGVVACAARVFLGERCPPYVVTAHGSDLNGLPGPVFRCLKKWVLTRAAAITVVSQSLQRQVLSLGEGIGPTVVLPMTIDTLTRFTPSDILRDDEHVLFVGRLVDSKGCDVLIRALSILKEEFPRLYLTVVGAGPCLSWLKALVASLKLSDRVEFVGHQPTEMLPDFYRRATLFVAPSLQEGFGLTLAEALACECPVVASDLPAFREWLSADAVSFVPPGDAIQAAKAIATLLPDRMRREAMGRMGRELVTELFDPRELVQKHVEVINRVMTLQESHG